MKPSTAVSAGGTPPHRALPYDTICGQIRGLIKNNKVDEAADAAAKFVKITAKTPEEAFKLQSMFENLAIECGEYSFVSKLSDGLNTHLPDTTPATFNPSTEPGIVLHASSHGSGMIDLAGNFNRTNVHDVLSPDFGNMSDTEKQSLIAIAPCVGRVLNRNGAHKGTCLLISEDLVMLPLHCVRDRIYIRGTCKAKTIEFLNPDMQSSTSIAVDSIVEAHPKLDMAVVKLSTSMQLDGSTLRFADTVLDGEKLFLLHDPSNTSTGSLQVSGNVAQLTTHDSYSIVTSHDSDYGSCGGVYFNSRGEVVGIHVGADRANAAMFGAQKYAYSLSDVSDNIEPSSEIYSFLTQEGKESQKDLANRLQASGKLAGVAVKKDGTVAFKVAKVSVVPALKAAYAVEFQQTVNASLGISGLHKDTSKYSIAGEIESDHPLPCEVWRDTDNNKLKQYAPGLVGRPGQWEMPAMTIPESVHSQLRSTIDPGFRKTLTQLCSMPPNGSNDIPGALKLVIGDYEKHKLLGTAAIDPRYKAGWVNMLDIFENKSILTAAEKAVVLGWL